MMKNKFKIITVVLSCLLLIGATVGLYASAAEGDAPEITIYKRSVSYEGAPKIVYLINTANAESYTAKIVFSEDNAYVPQVDDVISDAGADVSYTVGNIGGKQPYDGTEYDYICSEGIAPAFATRPEYAYPVLVDADNKIVAVGALEKYSLFDYYTARLSQDDVSDVSANLYKAALAYSASVQDVLLEENPAAYSEADLEKYGYADAYYVVNATIKVDGEVATTEKVCYREADVTIEAPKAYGGKIFAGFTDAAGNALTMYGAENTASSWNYYDTTLVIGENEFTYNYAGGSVQTWDDITTPGASEYICSQGGAQLDSLNEEKTSAYTENGALSLYNNGWALVNIDNKNSKTGEVGKTYVFETDIMLEKPTSYSGDATMGVFYLASSYDKAYNTMFTYFPINYTDKSNGGNRYSIRLADNTATNGSWTDLAYLQFDEWYNVRIEYTVKVLGTTGNDIGSIRVYVDGEKVADYASCSGYNTGISNSKFGGIGWEAKGTGKYTFHFDNTYLATED